MNSPDLCYLKLIEYDEIIKFQAKKSAIKNCKYLERKCILHFERIYQNIQILHISDIILKKSNYL